MSHNKKALAVTSHQDDHLLIYKIFSFLRQVDTFNEVKSPFIDGDVFTFFCRCLTQRDISLAATGNNMLNKAQKGHVKKGQMKLYTTK